MPGNVVPSPSVRTDHRLPEAIELIIRPGSVFARIARRPTPTIAILAAYALPLTAIAAFFSFTYAGAITLGHFAANFATFACLFALQATLVAAIARLLLRRPARPVVHAFALTYLPYDLLFIALLGIFVIAPDPYALLPAIIFSFALPIAFGVAFVASLILTFVAFREAAPARRRLVALAATISYAVSFAALVTLYIRVFSLLPLPAGSP